MRAEERVGPAAALGVERSLDVDEAGPLDLHGVALLRDAVQREREDGAHLRLLRHAAAAAALLARGRRRRARLAELVDAERDAPAERVRQHVRRLLGVALAATQEAQRHHARRQAQRRPTHGCGVVRDRDAEGRRERGVLRELLLAPLATARECREQRVRGLVVRRIEHKIVVQSGPAQQRGRGVCHR